MVALCLHPPSGMEKALGHPSREGWLRVGKFLPWGNEDIVLNMDSIIGEELEDVCLAVEMPFPRARDRYASRIPWKKAQDTQDCLSGIFPEILHIPIPWCSPPWLDICHRQLGSLAFDGKWCWWNRSFFRVWSCLTRLLWTSPWLTPCLVLLGSAWSALQETGKPCV